jgi:hypothetical protein
MDPKNAALFANGSNLKAAPQRWTGKAKSGLGRPYWCASAEAERHAGCPSSYVSG